MSESKADWQLNLLKGVHTKETEERGDRQDKTTMEKLGFDNPSTAPSAPPPPPAYNQIGSDPVLQQGAAPYPQGKNRGQCIPLGEGGGLSEAWSCLGLRTGLRSYEEHMKESLLYPQAQLREES